MEGLLSMGPTQSSFDANWPFCGVLYLDLAEGEAPRR